MGRFTLGTPQYASGKKRTAKVDYLQKVLDKYHAAFNLKAGEVTPQEAVLKWPRLTREVPKKKSLAGQRYRFSEPSPGSGHSPNSNASPEKLTGGDSSPLAQPLSPSSPEPFSPLGTNLASDSATSVQKEKIGYNGKQKRKSKNSKNTVRVLSRKGPLLNAVRTDAYFADISASEEESDQESVSSGSSKEYGSQNSSSNCSCSDCEGSDASSEEENPLSTDSSSDDSSDPELDPVTTLPLRDGEPEPPQEDEEECPLAKLEKILINIYSTTTMSKEAGIKVARVFQMVELISAANDVAGGKLPSFQTILRKDELKRPVIYMDIKWRHRISRRTTLYTQQVVYPKKRFGNRRIYEELFVFTYMRIKKIIKYHNKKHQLKAKTYILSVDDVPEAKSNPISETVFSLNFPPCREVYPWIVLRTMKRKAVTIQQYMPPVVRELNSCGLKLRGIVADKIMRANLSCHKSSGGYFCCEKCIVKGKTENKTRVYVSNRSALRSDAGYREIAENLDEYRTDNKKLGIKGRSPLLDLIGYSCVNSMPAEPMHNYCLGVLRRTWSLTFVKGSKFKGRLELVEVAKEIEELLLTIRVPSEFTRRTLELHVKHLKASQWLHLGLNLHPFINEKLKGLMVQDVWILLTFLFRGYMLNDEEYDRALANNDFEQLHEVFLELYIEEFGSANIVYNLHAIQHSPQVRALYTFTGISAFKFEAFFQVLTSKWKSGTYSLGKQGIGGSMRRKQQGHACQKSMVFKSKTTTFSDDTIIYDREWNIYKIKKVSGEGIHVQVRAQKLKKGSLRHTLACGTQLEYNQVGAFHCPGMLEEAEGLTTLSYKQIKGKGVYVGDVISLISHAVLQET
jgi:hypothetical protein